MTAAANLRPAALPTVDAVQSRARGENFTVAGAFLGPTFARHLRAIYGYARLVDELGDSVQGDRLLLLDLVEHELGSAFPDEQRHPVLREVVRTVNECGLPREPLYRLLDANRRDQVETEYATFADLVSYCTLSANPVGELVLHVFGAATPERIGLSDDVCTALQLVEHWQDVGEDARAGRVYLPAEDRARFGVGREELTAPVTSEALRQLLAFESQRAADLLASGTRLVGTLRGRGRLAVAGYVGGGLAALRALAECDYDVLVVHARSSRVRRARVSLGVLAGAGR